ncbi:dolichyldiphosphatase [Maudiozyma humilis]|uniref:Dolichyldiphosphatase n=1 Tax=Maudiozyma humilis TaxID=51915 RepID=A0AAV5S2N5_MAUHU|nr:dolichyldiphosphatase [Kazachstania humilis]
MPNSTLPHVIPFDETLVLYNPHDPLALPCILLSLSPILILAFYLSWLIITRDIESVVVAGGQLLNELSNKILKRLLKEPRPHAALIGPGYGMPSAHAQFAGFFCAYWTLRVWVRWYNPRNAHRTARRIIYTTALLAAAAAICAARVRLHYHSVEQTAVGFAVGALLATLYFAAVGIARTMGIVHAVTRWPLCRRLYIHDGGSDAPEPLYMQYSRVRRGS